ncbi:sensor histidine kinase [Kitasatospora sp. NPDC004240]
MNGLHRRPGATTDGTPPNATDGAPGGRPDGTPRHRPDGTPASRPDGTPWTHSDALVAVGACAIDLIGYLLFNHTDTGQGTSVPGFLAVVLSALPLLARRRRPLAALAAVLALTAAADLSAPTTTHFGAVLVVALYSVARARPLPVTAAAAAVTSLVTLLSQSHFHTPSWQAAVSTPFSALLVAGAGLAFSRWQRQVAAHRELLADRAVAEERRRIARELHDIVAHHITTMQLMAGGARANLANPDVARDALVTLESSGRLALSEMRQLLDVLRAGDEPDTVPPAPQPGVRDLDRLVDEARRDGLPTDLTVHGTPRPLPPTLGLTVFRIVQESLTNARKHAGPARVRVHLTHHPDHLTIDVRDDGPATPPPTTGPARDGGGHGLIGMRERVTLHGGTLRCGPHPDGGFAVHADLPLPPHDTDTTDTTGAAALRPAQVNR